MTFRVRLFRKSQRRRKAAVELGEDKRSNRRRETSDEGVNAIRVWSDVRVVLLRFRKER